MLRGIILIATGHGNYGKLAYNLALTIKAVDYIPIAVVTDSVGLSHLRENERNIFDHIIDIPEEYKDGFGAKLFLDKLTPFKKTLFLDADMLWLSKNPNELFEILEGKQFATITEGDSENENLKYYFWANKDEIKEAYGVKKIPQIRSEVIYFEDSKVFKTARKLKPENKLKTIRYFGEQIPDELYFNIACAQLEHDPNIGFMPAYWNRLHGEIMLPLQELHNKYFLLSFGSNAASPIQKQTYEKVMKVVCYKLGLQFLYPLRSKKEWAQGRLKI